MSLQDGPVKIFSTKGQVVFDNGLELTLISSFFTKKNNLYQEATYSISGIGGGATTFSSGVKGRI